MPISIMLLESLPFEHGWNPERLKAFPLYDGSVLSSLELSLIFKAGALNN